MLLSQFLGGLAAGPPNPSAALGEPKDPRLGIPLCASAHGRTTKEHEAIMAHVHDMQAKHCDTVTVIRHSSYLKPIKRKPQKRSYLPRPTTVNKQKKKESGEFENSKQFNFISQTVSGVKREVGGVVAGAAGGWGE